MHAWDQMDIPQERGWKKVGGFCRKSEPSQKTSKKPRALRKDKKRDKLKKKQTWVRKECRGSVSEASQPLQSELAWHRVMGQRRSRHVPACLSGMGTGYQWA